MKLHNIAADGLEPDLRVLFDLPVRDGLQRRFAEGGSVNRLDAASEAFHERVRSVYRHLAAENPSCWLTIDAGADMQQVTIEALDGILTRLGPELDALMITQRAGTTRTIDP
jgi:dTMP kinase